MSVYYTLGIKDPTLICKVIRNHQQKIQKKISTIFLQQLADEESGNQSADDLFEPLTPDRSPSNLFMSDDEEAEDVVSEGSSFQ